MEKNRYLKLNFLTVTLFLSVVALFFGLQFSVWGKFADPDGFYHATASQLLMKGELGDTFPWLQYTTWKDNYADQHYLYHWLLVPFNNINLLPISIILFAIIFVASFWLLLGRLQITYKPFWIFLMLLGSVDFLFRINLVKANTLSLALLCGVAYYVYNFHTERNKKWDLIAIGVLSGIFAWTYGGFVCLPLFVGAYSTAVLIIQRRLVIAPLIVSLMGIFLALLVHPHNSHILSLLYDQVFQTGLGAGSVVPAGNEWLPIDIYWFFKSNILILIAWLFAIILAANNLRKKNLTWLSLWLHIVAIGFVILTLWHRRFVEYWAPFAVIAAAESLTPYLSKLSWADFKQSLQKFWQVQLSVSLVIGLVIVFAGYNGLQTYRSMASGVAVTKYQTAALWLNNNSQPGDLVLDTQWDQFPQLFYWDQKNYYMVGLDPMFMYLYDQNIYWQWRKVADDNSSDWQSIEQLHNLIATDLKAKYIFIETDRNNNLYNYLSYNDANHQYFENVFSERDIVIFKVK